MSNFFINIYDKFSSRRRIVWVALLALIAVMIGLATTLEYQEDISSFLPSDEQSAKYASVYSNFSRQEKIAVIFKAETADEDNIERLQDAMETFGQMLTERDTAGCICNLQTHVEEEKLLEALQFVGQNYPYMLTESEFQRIDSALSDTAFIHQQMEGNRQMLMLPTGPMVTQNLQSDPLHFSTPIASSMRNANVSSSFRIVDGYVFTKKGDVGLIFFESPYGVSESRMNASLSQMIEDVINDYHQQNVKSNIEISAIGAPLIAVTNAKQIKQDSILAVCLAVVLIMLVLIYSFRRFGDIFWIGVSIAVGWFFALGCIALLKDGISIIVLGIGSVIIGIAVNYPLHFLAHLQHVPDKRSALKEMVQPLLIGNITTVSAFLCMVVLDAEAMRDLGLFSSLMLVGTIFFVLIFLPILVSGKPRKQGGGEAVSKAVDFASVSNPLYKKTMLWIVAGLTIVLGYFSFDTSFDADMQHINYMTSSQRQDMQLLLESMQKKDSTVLLYAIAEGKDLEEALQHNEQLISSIQDINGIAKISGIGQLLPSQARQRENLKLWSQLWRKHSEAKEQFMKSCQQVGFSPSAFTTFTELTEAELDLLETSQFMEAGKMITENFVIQDEEGVKVANFLNVDSTHYQSIKEQIKSSIPNGTYVFDSKDVTGHLVTLLSDSFNYIGYVCSFVVFFFLWLSFGRLELGMLSFLPLAVSWAWILGIMQLTGIQFNIVNIILATFIFGQGDDYTIFITEGMMYEYAYGKKTMAAYRRSVAISAVIMFIGISTLIISKHPALRSLAEVAIVGMIIVVIMAYYLPPMVFRKLTTSHGEVREFPVTLKRFVFSLYALMAFIVGLIISLPRIYFYSLFEKRQERRSQFIHNLLYKFSRFVIQRVPGTDYKILNPKEETFEKPSLIICNHQSQLDLMAVMSLSPKITILTKDWVWKNPYYGKIIRASEFYPVTDGVDSYLEGMRSMIKRGYSIVVFPEGTRSADGILRFHKGAFLLAQELGLDILPVYLHGFNKVLPRHDFMLREGRMTMEIGERMPVEQVLATESMRLRSHFHRQYVKHYAEMCRRFETSSYFIPYVRYKYMYKGVDIERSCKKVLRDTKAIAKLIDRDYSSVESYFFEEPGQGELPLLFALVHRNMEVYAEFTDEDDYLVATNIQGLPANLHYSMAEPAFTFYEDIEAEAMK